MTPERWQEVKDVFDRAVHYGPASRMAFIREHCGEDEELKSEVESLLASDQKTGFLDNPLMETGISVPTAFFPAGSSATHGDSFGPYAPVRVLGEGGMGTVFLARQQRPICREVALKVVKLGLDSHQVLERFEAERQVLALMEYPNIARVLDAGTSEQGRPYFVMEYVDGVPITQYCDRHTFSTRERLQLFIPVCNALQYAHKKGIIHRDVKPSNVLVTEVDGKPAPKVIDFGIARATNQRVMAGETFTLDGQIVGTPEYMSPEQASMDSRDIDTGTDVYSLGVVLYELLVGALPLDMKPLRKIALGEVLRAIQETPVLKPTARITQMGATAQAMARQRGTDPGQLKRDLSGDLDSIVMKAIEKDRHCRYASASEFAADIERYLRSEPVLAGPPGTTYRMRKFVVRHMRPVAAAAAVVLALIAGIVTTAWQARVAGQQKAVAVREKAEAQGQRTRAERQAAEAARQRDAAEIASIRAAAAERTARLERDRAQQERNASRAEKRRADQEAATATAVNDFLRNDLLSLASANSQARPDNNPDPDLTVRTALDRAAAHIAGKFDNQPLVEASIRLTIGNTYMNLGRYSEAQREMERAVDLRGRVLGGEHPDTLKALISLGELHVRIGKYAQAEALFTKVLEVGRRVLGGEHPDTLKAMGLLGWVYQYQAKYTQAELLASKVLEVSRRVLGEEHPDTLDAVNSLAALYLKQAKYAQAEPFATKFLEISRRVLGEEHPDTLIAMNTLAIVYRNQGKYDLAETLATKVLEVSRRVLGEEHPDTLSAMNTLGNFYQSQGNYAQAELLATKVLEVRSRLLGAEHPSTQTAISNLGTLYRNQGNYAQAEPLFTKLLEVRHRLLGEEDVRTLASMNNLGVVYLNEGKYAQAGPLFTKVLEVRRHMLGPQHPDTADAKVSLAGLWLRQGRYADAEPLLREVVNDYEKIPDGWVRYRIQSMLGGSLAGQRKHAEAEPLLLSGYRGIIQREATIPRVDRSEAETAGGRIVQLYLDWGKPEQAAEWRMKLDARNTVPKKDR